MNDRPDDAALAAIAAAYAIVMRARSIAPPPVVPRWRMAARVALDDAPAARVASHRSAWRAATGP